MGYALMGYALPGSQQLAVKAVQAVSQDGPAVLCEQVLVSQ